VISFAEGPLETRPDSPAFASGGDMVHDDSAITHVARTRNILEILNLIRSEEKGCRCTGRHAENLLATKLLKING
jgi:hypothetical protein